MANILIVDDLETDRFCEAQIIEDAGHTPFFASDGEAAMTMYQENDIDRLSSDAVELLYVTDCERCVMTTTDQRTGVRATKEPIKTLSTYRRREDKYASGVVFGAYMSVSKEGKLKLGDRLTIS